MAEKRSRSKSRKLQEELNRLTKAIEDIFTTLGDLQVQINRLESKISKIELSYDPKFRELSASLKSLKRDQESIVQQIQRLYQTLSSQPSEPVTGEVKKISTIEAIVEAMYQLGKKRGKIP